VEIRKLNFKKNSVRALENKTLQQALHYTTERFTSARERAKREFGELDNLREKAREIKKRTIENLDSYLEMLEENVCKAGGKVYWAEDAKGAVDTVLDIARKNRVKLVVKSKSMATEEIELNRAIEGEGIDVVETDLGEYIVQLANERPSHIIAPAIHKTKDEIARLFSEKLKIPYYKEPELIVGVTRERLRATFLRADMGVTGVNFAVAETGTIIIVENEGNARFVTTVPRVHVAIMGIEKVIPSFKDAAVFLSILARSATGQKMSSYVSFITGPRRNGEIDGPEQFHLIIMDNGRTRVLGSEETRETLYCIRCGACLNACPVYRKAGGHSYGWVYSGPIGAILTPQLIGMDRALELPFASTLCGACREVCPVKINIPRILVGLRRRVIENGFHKNVKEHLAMRIWRFVVSHTGVYDILTSLLYVLQHPFKSDGKLRSLPLFSQWTRYRDLPVLKIPFRKRWKRSTVNRGPRG
jgi:L-lactate dehydrogenase complex protein LldF